MATPTRLHLHHIAVTVTDLEARTPWYESVFGLTTTMDLPHPGGVGRLLTDEAGDLIIVLHGHDTNDGALFRETVAGLDHVGLRVATRADLEAWQVHLDANGVERCAVADKPLTQSPIADEVYGFGARLPRPGQHPARDLMPEGDTNAVGVERLL